MKWKYSALIILLLAEFSKLLILLLIYRLKGKTILDLFTSLSANVGQWQLSIIACFLQTIGSILHFINLTLMDPPTYLTFYHLRFVALTIIDEFLLKRSVSLNQWASLSLLVLAAGVKMLKINKEIRLIIPTHFFLVFLQIAFESTAYFLLEKQPHSRKDDVTQSVFHSLNSVIVYSLIFRFNVNLQFDYFTPIKQTPVYLLLLHIIIMGVLDKISQNSSNIQKFRSAIQLIASCWFSKMAFDLEVNGQTLVSVLLVWLFLTMNIE